MTLVGRWSAARSPNGSEHTRARTASFSCPDGKPAPPVRHPQIRIFQFAFRVVSSQSLVSCGRPRDHLSVSLSAVCAQRSTQVLGGLLANLCRHLAGGALARLWAHFLGQGLAGPRCRSFSSAAIVGFGFGDVALYQHSRLGSACPFLLIHCVRHLWCAAGMALAGYGPGWGEILAA